MVNRRAFFEIFFYNRENRSREMMEAAESVWRAYMKKYGLGLDAGTDGQPTYDEVREITYLANAAIARLKTLMAGGQVSGNVLVPCRFYPRLSTGPAPGTKGGK